MELQTVKFVRIFPKLPDGTMETVNVPIDQPQKIRAYIDSGDLQPKNAAVNDHGWRLDPTITAQIRDILDDQNKLEQIARDTGKTLDMLNAFHVLMYEIARNRQMAAKAATNSLDKTTAVSEYEQAVAKARTGVQPDEPPAPGTGAKYTPKSK